MQLGQVFCNGQKKASPAKEKGPTEDDDDFSAALGKRTQGILVQRPPPSALGDDEKAAGYFWSS